MLTEEEAKTKWCPFIRCYGNNQQWGSDRSAAPISACCGSRCMSWRWGFSYWKDDLGRTYSSQNEAFGRGDRTYEEVRTGYCGLAGKP